MTEEPQSEIEFLPGGEGTVSAKEAAQLVLSYALKHRLFDTGAVDPDALEPDPPLDQEALARSQRRLEAQNVLEVFRGRVINLIGYDERRRKILIFTKRKVTGKELKVLPASIASQVNIEYHVGGVPQVRGTGSEFFGSAPYSIVDDRYACGSSIFPANCMGAGTLGALARDSLGRLCGLSNNHVTGACNHSDPGLPILAPGPVDVHADGPDPFTIGRHVKLLPIHDGHPDMINIDQNLDAAYFEISDPNRVTSSQGGHYDTPSTVAPLEVGLRVEKVGRTTGRTSGEVIAVAAGPRSVSYEVREYGIRKSVFFAAEVLYVVKSDLYPLFSASGDSGSLVTAIDDAGNRTAVGIVFAGDERNGLSFVLPLDKILTGLGLTLVNGHNA